MTQHKTRSVEMHTHRKGHRIVVIIPAHNEEGTIGLVVSRVLRIKNVYRCVVVDDGSSDNTGKYARESGAEVISNRSNEGSGKAIQKGLQQALRHSADIVVCMDADGQHNPDHIPRLVQEIYFGTDFVIASRYIQKTPLTTSRLRVFGTRIISQWFWIWFRQRIYDPTSGYRAINGQTAKYYSIHYPLLFSEPEMLLQAFKRQLTVREIACATRQRKYGKSSISLLKALILMCYIFVAIPYHSVKCRLK